MRLVITGHSMINYRQWSMARAIADLGHDVLVICPERWGDETGKRLVEEHFQMLPLPLQSVDRAPYVNFINFWLFRIEKYIMEFKPEFIYLMEEPFSAFTAQLSQMFPEVKKACYTWENRSELWQEDAFQQFWAQTENGIDLLVCGNKGAEEIAIHRQGKPKLVRIPQTGIDIERFKPYKVEKKWDLGVFGRMIEAKGIRFIDSAARQLNLKVLWQGRGELKPECESTWVSHEDLPPLYCQCRMVIQFPYNFMGYAEQGNFVIAEAMACGVPVIHSNNGSLSDFYQGSPAKVVRQANVEELIGAIRSIMSSSQKEYDQLSRAGRKWVIEHMSQEAIVRRLVNAFEAQLGCRR